MKRIALWFLTTLSTVVALFGYHTSTSGALATNAAPSTTTTPTGGDTSGDTVTGDVAQTRWGPVQVQLTMSGSRITGVTVLQQPDGNHEDVEINGYALPILIQETTDAQSADIDMVSGATVTSEGYRQSLQSALDQVGS